MAAIISNEATCRQKISHIMFCHSCCHRFVGPFPSCFASAQSVLTADCWRRGGRPSASWVRWGPIFCTIRLRKWNRSRLFAFPSLPRQSQTDMNTTSVSNILQIVFSLHFELLRDLNFHSPHWVEGSTFPGFYFPLIMLLPETTTDAQRRLNWVKRSEVSHCYLHLL